MIEDSTSAPAKRQRATRDWRERYASRLAVTDLLVLIWVVFGVQIAWFGFDSTNVAFRGDLQNLAISYTAISVVLVVGWTLTLAFYGTRGYRIIGTGTSEYKLIADASLRLFGLVAIVAFLFHIDFARGYILIAFPLGLVVLLASRWLWRQWLNVQRLRGAYSSRALLVGSVQSVEQLGRQLASQPTSGYWVVGACVPNGSGFQVPGMSVPVLGNLNELQFALDESGADTVIITSSDDLPPDRVRMLSWSLEPGRQHLVVAPSLIDIGGPRIHTRPVAGLPLIHVETPRYEGRKLYAKRSFDMALAVILIVLLSPLLLAIALAVRMTSSGPVLFKQERIGLHGTPFKMLKFRSMVVDAEAQLELLRAQEHDAGNNVMFKMKHDPRITKVGKFLRRYSLDELPQLFNVARGTMSLVGPRPSLERELAQYEEHTHRRFLVKPGITGLWQVSGRSNLTWEETVRLDLYYVENWSMTGDLAILWRTAKAVFEREGAY